MPRNSEYQVFWEIDVSATSIWDAALKALAIQRDPASTATVFDVRRHGEQSLSQVDVGAPNRYWGASSKRSPWRYKGIDVYPAELNGSGIAWYARPGTGQALRADSKRSMRELITEMKEQGRL